MVGKAKGPTEQTKQKTKTNSQTNTKNKQMRQTANNTKLTPHETNKQVQQRNQTIPADKQGETNPNF